MNSKFELGKDYIFNCGKILTCCNFDEAANCIDFVYKNNITPEDNVFGFCGHYIPFVNPKILGEYRNTYYTHIYDLLTVILMNSSCVDKIIKIYP